MFIFFFSVKLNALLILMVFILIISINFIIKRKKMISKNDIIIGTILMIICLFSNPTLGILVLPAYIASCSILKDSSYCISFFGKSKNTSKTLLCIIIVGGILSVINIFLNGGKIELNLDSSIMYFFTALGIGIYEEILFRMFYFSICIYILKGKKMNNTQKILSYMIMILPHVLLHPNIDLISIIILSLLFGLSFAVMQRKLNLVSAIASHALVDFIRFIFLGV